MTTQDMLMFTIAERLHMSVVQVERMSCREVQGWFDYWQQEGAHHAARQDADAIDAKTLTRDELRAMFSKG